MNESIEQLAERYIKQLKVLSGLNLMIEEMQDDVQCSFSAEPSGSPTSQSSTTEARALATLDLSRQVDQAKRVIYRSSQDLQVFINDIANTLKGTN